MADLPASRPAAADVAGDLAGPRNATEESLHAIWAGLLREKNFGINDDFFKLGGNSLKATQMISRIASRWHVEIKLTEVFGNSTISKLGQLIESREAKAYKTIEPVGRREFYELSHAQRRLWVLSQFEEATSAYNVPLAYKLVGRLDTDAFRRAFWTLVVRHESLRTVFVTVDGVPRQKILSPGELDSELRAVDFSAASDAEVRAYLEAEAATPFDLTTGPLIRAALLRLAEDSHLCLLTVHHIVSDGWSSRVLASELLTLYHAYHEGGANPLPPLRIQYKDYAAWQNALIESRIQEHRDYWLGQFSGELRPLDLPTDFPRPAVQTYGGDTFVLTLREPLLGRARALGHRLNATLFMVLLASVKSLLYRYTGQQDITVGTPSAGRDHSDLENQVGFYVNTLALRTQFRGEEGFAELVRRVRQTTLGAQEHQLYPFDRLVEELNLERDMSRSPLFDVSVVLQNADVKISGASQIEGVTVEPYGTLDKTSKFDLSFDFRESKDELSLTIEYNTDLFTEARIRQIAAQYEGLFAAVTLDAATPLCELDYVPADEKRRLLEEFNDTRFDFRGGATAVELFEEQAERRGEAVAVTCGEESVTYDELNRRANRLGRALVEAGVGPDAVVALLADRGVAFLTAVLGAFKAGGAYLPLDPRHPTQRIADVLLQSAAPVVLHTSEMAPVIAAAVDALPPEKRPQVLSVEELLGQEHPEGNLRVRCAPGNLAYVIFTSGSTGRPKGAMLEHDGLLNHLHAMIHDMKLTESDVIAQTASQCFDISVWQFLTALLVGGRTHIITDEAAQDPARLIEEVAGGVTILEVVPSILRLVIDEGERRRGAAAPAPLATLRWLLPTGEALPPELVRRWFKLNPRIPLLNAYGPTECSDDVSLQPIYQPPPAERVNMPIGRPVANMRLYVLDDRLQPVPSGVVGELYVAGRGVGRGYLGDPARTAEVFLPDPFASEAGARFYRTGDTARFTPEGEIEFLGRIDYQVKIRGFRIELGEIEAALAEHPAVREGVVLARGGGEDGQRLVAYLVPHTETTASAETRVPGQSAGVPTRAGGGEELIADVLAHLQSRLPEYMIPSAFMVLERLPLTPNGKLDRRALPSPDAAIAIDGAGYVAPRTPVEELVAGIWATVLRQRVGVHDNFFKLGGHSLLATLVISRLREALHVELSIRSLFVSPTVAGLARDVEDALRDGQQKRQVPRLERAERGGELPLSFAQEHLWSEEQIAPGDSSAKVAVAVRLSGPLNLNVLRRALSEVVNRHEPLRTVFPAVEGRPAQVILPESNVSPPLVESGGVDAARRGAEAQTLLAEDSRLPFNLAEGPLLRLRLVRFDAEEHALLLTMHRIVGDAWSARLFVREVASVYEAMMEGKASPLPELTLHHADYAAWQRSWLHGKALDELTAYFTRRLSGARPLELPTDHPRPPSRNARRAAHAFDVTPELYQALKDLSRDEAASLFMTLAAAFHALLVRYAGRGEIVLTTQVANRDRVELEGLIGPFDNTVAVRTDASGELSFKETLVRVRRDLVGAYAHQDMPFSRLSEALSPQGRPHETPLLQTMLVLEHSPWDEIEVAGLKLSLLAADDGGAKCDVELRMTEGADGLSGHWDYNAEMFESGTVGRMARHYERLLASIVAAPDRPVSELSMATEEEAVHVIAGFNDDLESY